MGKNSAKNGHKPATKVSAALKAAKNSSPDAFNSRIKPNGKNGKIIDFRSDTVTRPSEKMKKAMVNAELGDDVLGDEPTVIAM